MDKDLITIVWTTIGSAVGLLTCLGGLLAWIYSRLDKKFLAIDQRFNAVDQRFNTVDAKFDIVNKRLQNVEGDIRVIQTVLVIKNIMPTESKMASAEEK